MRVVGSEGGELGISLLRKDGDLGARDSSLLASLAPHLAIALRARSEMERERRRANLLSVTLDRFGMGWLLIDRRGRVLDCDAATQAHLERGTVLRRGGEGRLRFTHAEAEALLDHALAARDDPVVSRAGWMTLNPPIQMAVMPPPDEDRGTLTPAHCLILTRRTAATGSSGSSSAFLTSLFGLTRSEATLALRIAEGDSIAEAAEKLNLTLETARNYSKRIYGKTGARGQAELVRLIWGGVPD